MGVSTYSLVRLVQTYSRIESRDSAECSPSISLSLFNRNGVWVSMIPDPRASDILAQGIASAGGSHIVSK